MRKNLNKKHMVVIADSIYPNATMNGMIASRIIDEAKQDFDIDVVVFKTPENNSKTKYPIYKTRYVYNWSWFYEYKIKELIKNKPDSFVYKSLYLIKRSISNIKRNLSKYGIDKGIEKNIEKMLEKINDHNRIDVLLSIAAPFELQIANYKYKIKHPHCRCICYQVDSWADLKDVGLPKFLHQWRRNNRIQIENEIAKKCILTMIPFAFASEGLLYKGALRAQLPLLKYNKAEDSIYDNKHYNIVYAGTLNFSERNPHKFLESVVYASSIEPVTFHVYHRGDCFNLINKYALQHDKVIFDYGTVSSDTAYKAISSADILLIIGTDKGDQIAGKTFDYISTGKKIIYLYQNAKDINIEFLSKYPNVKFMNYTNSIDQLGKAIAEFATKKLDTLSFEIVSNLYSEALPKNFVSNYLI